MRARIFEEESLEQLLAFLAVSHPRAGACSPWAQLPEAIQRRIAVFVLQPMCTEFTRWDPMAIVRGSMRSLSFGLRLRRRCAMQFHIANDEGIAICGPPLRPGSGLYEVEYSVKELFSLDNFCRADIGVVMDPANPERNGSGVWWEAGDGDVYVAPDMLSVSPKGKPGWLGNDFRVDEGVLPRWDGLGAVGLVVDTCGRRLGFTLCGRVMPFEMSLPPGATLHFAVGWSGDTGGTMRIERLRRLTRETTGPLGRLMASLQSAPAAAPAAVREFARSAPGGVSAEVVADAMDAMPGDSRHRAAAVAALAQATTCGRACSGGISSTVAAAALQQLRVRSSQERLVVDLAGHVSDPWNYDATALSGVLPDLSSAKRAEVASHLWRSRVLSWVRTSCWCCR
uniref:Uncharacterized protein n=1 Tax=Alexandrium monilatum TaxID=311494 RepID=A0A7S4UVI3_9DINO|mmetsp:Transcript_39397/g.117955  ORF Transcript_39397/g.117955 Transcript_39397/m.117955 type:complete len:397 (+) Transcript_39397:126-1316(+)